MKTKKIKEAAPRKLYQTKRFWVAAVAGLLVVALLLLALFTALFSSAAVYSYGGATLREDAFLYWFASLKYVYQVRYKGFEIADTPEGWAALDKSGRSFEELFYEMITEEIRMRFVAASLFDHGGHTLPTASYEELATLIDELGTESYGVVPFRALKEDYGISRRTVKQVGLYEQKYMALYSVLFSDTSVVYAAEYSEALADFYRENYSRYNMITVADSAGTDKIAALEAALATGVTEAEFDSLARTYDTGTAVTEKHPGGIYLYGGENYTNAWSEELASAFREADTVGKVVKKRNAADNGSYYVMRYALDDAPYLSEDAKVKEDFKKFASYAAEHFFRQMLRKEAEAVFSHGVAENYTVFGTKRCKEFNIIYLLGH